MAQIVSLGARFNGVRLSAAEYDWLKAHGGAPHDMIEDICGGESVRGVAFTSGVTVYETLRQGPLLTSHRDFESARQAVLETAAHPAPVEAPEATKATPLRDRPPPPESRW